MAFVFGFIAGSYLGYKGIKAIFKKPVEHSDGCVTYVAKVQFKLGEIFNDVFSLLDSEVNIHRTTVQWLREAASKAKSFLDDFLCNDILIILQENGGITGAFASAAASVKDIMMDGIEEFDGALTYAERMLDKINAGIDYFKESVVEIYATATFAAAHKADTCPNHPSCIGIGCDCYLHSE